MKFEALESNLLFLGEGILLNTISCPKNVIWGIGEPFLMDFAINVFLFSRFKHFQLRVVDYPPSGNGKFDSRSNTSDFT